MPIRTGADYLESLRDDRHVSIDGERVKDVTTDPRFTGAAHTMAELLDLQHDPYHSGLRRRCDRPQPGHRGLDGIFLRHAGPQPGL